MTTGKLHIVHETANDNDDPDYEGSILRLMRQPGYGPKVIAANMAMMVMAACVAAFDYDGVRYFGELAARAMTAAAMEAARAGVLNGFEALKERLRND